MRKISLAAALITLSIGLFADNAQAWVGVRIGIGVPLYVGPGPYYYGYPYPYYAPYYAVPPTVVYQSAPPATVVTAPAVAAAPGTAPAAPAAPVVARSPVPAEEIAAPINAQPQPLPAITTINSMPTAPPILQEANPQIDGIVQRLSDPSETARRDAALDLGRMNADRAVETLINVMKKDSSPIARDAAARALGLIAAPRSLNALIYTAQADNDREVRHSAQFAVEVIRNKLRGQ